MTCNHPTGEVGWSICDECFHADQFDSRGYWALRLSITLMLIIAWGFIAAALVEMA